MNLLQAIPVSKRVLRLSGHITPLFLAILLISISFGTAHAVCPSSATWTYDQPVTQVTRDTGFSFGGCYFGMGASVSRVWSENGPGHVGGEKDWTWTSPSGSTVNNFPVPVPLTTPPPAKEYIFVTTDDAFLYKIDAVTGSTAGSTNLKRGGCLTDQVIATPAVQLYQFSNASFQGAWNNDAVFVITKYDDACGSNQNRVYGLFGSSLTPKWVFNSPQVYPMGPANDACSINYTNNLLYCGTDQTIPGPPTLWAINTVTGALQWSQDVGPVRNRPQIAGTKLYVANANGLLYSLDATSGAQLWAAPVPLPAPIVRNPWVEFRAPLPNRIYLVDQDGYFRAYEDTGPTAVEIWPGTKSDGLSFTSMPAVWPGEGKAYIARSDGKVQQVNLGNGSTEATTDVGAPGTLFDPSLDKSSSIVPEFDRLNVACGGRVQRFCVPWDVVGSPATTPVTTALLRQNAPNPFQSTTRIEYVLPEAGRVQLGIYDLRGTPVRTLLDDSRDAGRYAEDWDGLTNDGAKAASGVYFYRLRIEERGKKAREESRKVVLVD